MATHPDVLVLGGGVVGLTTAYRLARDGVRVEVIDKGEFGSEASWAGAGIIPPGNPERAAAPYDRLRALSSRLFPRLTEELREATGIDNGYRVCGGIEFLADDDFETLPAWRAEGVAHEGLTPERLAVLEPSLMLPGGRNYLLPGMAQVRNPWHVRMLVAGCAAAGVILTPVTPVASLQVRGSRIDGVRLASGDTRAAQQYLVAAGAWSDALVRPLGAKTGIHPVLGQIVLFKTAHPVLRRVVLDGKRYLVPRRDGHVLVGSTEEPEAGFEKRTTPEALGELVTFAEALVPALADAERVKSWAGLRPGSLDGLPSLGRVGEFSNLFLAGGHFRAGIQLSPATALVMTELLTGRAPSVPLDDFRVGREPGKPFRPAFRS